MNIAFYASPDIALSTFKALYEDKKHKISLLITQADKKSGRGQKIKMSKIKEFALENNINIFQPTSSKEIFTEITKHQIDLNLVFAFGMILKKNVLNYPKFGSVNIHTSILPKYRGASPITEAILNGDKETGISIMKMDEEMDHGNIITTLKIEIKEGEKASELAERMSELIAKNICEIVEKISSETFNEKEQNHNNASYCKKHTDKDAEINFLEKMENVLNKIRAFDTNPKAHFFLKNGQKLIINTATKSEKKLNPTMIEIENKRLFIGTNTNAIEIIELTLEGKKQLKTKDFLNGYSKIFNK